MNRLTLNKRKDIVHFSLAFSFLFFDPRQQTKAKAFHRDFIQQNRREMFSRSFRKSMEPSMKRVSDPLPDIARVRKWYRRIDI